MQTEVNDHVENVGMEGRNEHGEISKMQCSFNDFLIQAWSSGDVTTSEYDGYHNNLLPMDQDNLQESTAARLVTHGGRVNFCGISFNGHGKLGA